MSRKGLDVSEFQGTINWPQVKSAGYQFGNAPAPDTDFPQSIVNFAETHPNGNRLGIPIGAYCFAMRSARKLPVKKQTG